MGLQSPVWACVSLGRKAPVVSSEPATKGTQAIADLGASSGGWPGHLALLFVSRGRALMFREAPAGHLLA